jgi:high potential iron-sulfur protein
MKASRRIVLRSAAIVAGLAAAPWVARPAAAQAKATKQAMQYQEQPKNDQKCADCLQFIPGPKQGANGTCKVVEGPISPNGWCAAYVKKT